MIDSRRRPERLASRRRVDGTRIDQPRETLEIGDGVHIEPWFEHGHLKATRAQALERAVERIRRTPRQIGEQPLWASANGEHVEAAVGCGTERRIRTRQRVACALQETPRQAGRVGADRDGNRRFTQCAPQHTLEARAEVTISLRPGRQRELRVERRVERPRGREYRKRPRDLSRRRTRIDEKAPRQERGALCAHVYTKARLGVARDGRLREDADLCSGHRETNARAEVLNSKQRLQNL